MMNRMVRLAAVVVMGAVAFGAVMPPVPSYAQEELDLSTYTFGDGTTVRYPSDFVVDESSDDIRLILDSEGTTFYIDAYSADEMAESELTDLASVVTFGFVPVDETYSLPIEEAVEIESNGVPMLWLRYVDDGFPGIIQAAEMPNGSVVVIDAYGAFYNSTDEGIALAILSDAALGNSDFTVDATNVPPVPFAPQPIGAPEFTVITFSDGTQARFSSLFEYELEEETIDFVTIETESGSLILDYYSADTAANLELETVFDVMTLAWFPLDETLILDEANIETIALGELVLYYWRYEDTGAPGIIMAIDGPDSGILVVDAFGAFPGSIGESYATAIAFDFAGDFNLLEGNPVEFSQTKDGPGLGNAQ